MFLSCIIQSGEGRSLPEEKIKISQLIFKEKTLTFAAPRLRPSRDHHSVSSESGASSSARGRAHRDRDVTPEWARFPIQAQQSSNERLFKLGTEF